VYFSHELGAKDSLTILTHLKDIWSSKMSITAKSSNQIIRMEWMETIKIHDSSQLIDMPLWELSNCLERRLLREAKPSVFKCTLEGLQNFLYSDLFCRGLIFPFHAYKKHQTNLRTDFPIQEGFVNEKGLENFLDLYRSSSTLFRRMKLENLQQYARLYSRYFVLILADTVRHFTDFSLNNLHLSPLHFTTLSAFSFSAAFAFSGASFESIKDEEIIN